MVQCRCICKYLLSRILHIRQADEDIIIRHSVTLQFQNTVLGVLIASALHILEHIPAHLVKRDIKI